jgi:hypothetical protein
MNANVSSPFETNRTVLGNVGKCIYCKRADVKLSEEHIIPYGLNGNQILLNASCSDCSKITSAFELDILRHTFLLPRRAFGMRSRHNQNDELSARFETGDGTTKYIQIPKDDAPIMFALPIFLPPSVLDNRPFQPGIQGTGEFQINEIRSIAKEKLKKKHGGPGKISFDIAYNPNNFARMIAKIAYGFAVAHFGIDDIGDLGIVSAIKGETDDIGKWVGCVKDEKFAINTVLHSWQMRISASYQIDNPKETMDARAIYGISLFSLFNTPEYTVVVGNVKNLMNKMTLPFGSQTD